jgi:hypothetical protein
VRRLKRWACRAVITRQALSRTKALRQSARGKATNLKASYKVLAGFLFLAGCDRISALGCILKGKRAIMVDTFETPCPVQFDSNTWQVTQRCATKTVFGWCSR